MLADDALRRVANASGVAPFAPRCGEKVARPKGGTDEGLSDAAAFKKSVRLLGMRTRNLQKSARAQSLRADTPQTEQWLWQKLRSRRLCGHKFVRQYPIGPYFADFACRETRLVIELDGSQHIESAGDERRDAYMVAEGYSVLRFWNDAARNDISSVCETILAAISGQLAPYDQYKIGLGWRSIAPPNLD